MQSKVDICFLPLSFVVSHAYIFNKYQNTVLFTFWKDALAAPFCLFRLESAAIHKKCSDWLKFPSRCPAGDWTWTVSKPLDNPTAAHMFNFWTPLRCSPSGDWIYTVSESSTTQCIKNWFHFRISFSLCSHQSDVLMSDNEIVSHKHDIVHYREYFADIVQ